jgi:hypothetical protein
VTPPRRNPTSIQALRQNRNFRDRDLSIVALVGELYGEVARQHRQVDGAGEAWARVVPRELGSRAQLQRLARGVLHVRVSDASARFALDRFLRSGGERSLVAASGGKVKRVKLA